MYGSCTYLGIRNKYAQMRVFLDVLHDVCVCVQGVRDALSSMRMHALSLHLRCFVL